MNSTPQFQPESDTTRYYPYWSLVWARVKEFTRRPEAVFWVYFFPVLMVLVLGSAFNNAPKPILEFDVVDQGLASEIQGLLQGDNDVKIRLRSENDCQVRLRTGKSQLYLTATGTDVAAMEIKYRYDETRTGALELRTRVDDRLQKKLGRVDRVRTTDETVAEPGGRYVDFLVPGLIGMGLLGGGLWGVGFAVVDMRIRKLLKRFLATPMRRSDFLLAIMTSRMVYMIPEVVLLVVVSKWVYGIQIYGSIGALLTVIVLGAFQFSGIGLLVAARAKSIETVSMLMNLVMLPLWVLSGIFFSYEKFPESFHPLIRMLPLTATIDSLRGVMNEGATLVSLWPQMAVMFGWTVVTFGIALTIFRWADE